MEKIDKIHIIKEVIEILSQDLRSIEKSIQTINDSINDAPGAMQSHSDTTRLQLTSVVNVSRESFLMKSKELEFLKIFSRKNLNNVEFKEAKNGAIIVVKKENGNIENYFFLPSGSGVKVRQGNYDITCITPISPLGKILFRSKKDQIVKFGQQRIEVLGIF